MLSRLSYEAILENVDEELFRLTTLGHCITGVWSCILPPNLAIDNPARLPGLMMATAPMNHVDIFQVFFQEPGDPPHAAVAAAVPTSIQLNIVFKHDVQKRFIAPVQHAVFALGVPV